MGWTGFYALIPLAGSCVEGFALLWMAEGVALLMKRVDLPCLISNGSWSGLGFALKDGVGLALRVARLGEVLGGWRV